MHFFRKHHQIHCHTPPKKMKQKTCFRTKNKLVCGFNPFETYSLEKLARHLPKLGYKFKKWNHLRKKHEKTVPLPVPKHKNPPQKAGLKPLRWRPPHWAWCWCCMCPGNRRQIPLVFCCETTERAFSEKVGETNVCLDMYHPWSFISSSGKTLLQGEPLQSLSMELWDSYKWPSTRVSLGL